VPRKSVFGIPDGFFIDHFADMPGNWEELLVEWALLFAAFLKLIHAPWKPKWVQNRASEPEPQYDVSKAIGKFIMFFLMVFVDSFILLCRATFAAAIGLINTMIVCIFVRVGFTLIKLSPALWYIHRFLF
jgi:hypothetical protein